MQFKASIIGAGSWGTSLAIVLAEKGFNLAMWVRRPEYRAQMEEARENLRYLPGVQLPANIYLTSELSEAAEAEVIVMAVPSHAMRAVAHQLKPYLSSSALIVNVSKGIENDTLLRMSQVLEETLDISGDRVATLSGPSHAEEVSRKIATAVVVASRNLQTARIIRDLFRTEFFRVYSSTDIVGVELGGSIKNVIAIAAGIADGAGFGDNTKAALITRALVEITRMGVHLGAQKETFAGLSGMGDLIVTCMSRHSRNRHVGEQIGKGSTLEEVLAEMTMVAEGVKTTKSVKQLIDRYQVEMPISEQVYQVLFQNKSPHQAVYDLMTRDPKEEMFGE